MQPFWPLRPSQHLLDAVLRAVRLLRLVRHDASAEPAVGAQIPAADSRQRLARALEAFGAAAPRPRSQGARIRGTS